MVGPLSAAYFDPLGGAVGQVDPSATPYAGRSTTYGFHLIADDEADRIPAAYGANYPRLVELKQRWDPTNLFSSNYNIPPG